MSQNNVKITWKAIVAIMLVMATIIAMSALVSAEFMEAFLGEEYAVMEESSDGCNWRGNGTQGVCNKCGKTRYNKICMKCSPAHTTIECSCPKPPTA